MNGKNSFVRRNPAGAISAIAVIGVVMCTALFAMFTQIRQDPPPFDGNKSALPSATLIGGPVLQVAAGGMDIGIGVKLVEMNRTIAQQNGIRNSSGGYVTDVQPGSPAQMAGLKVGDIVNRINGR